MHYITKKFKGYPFAHRQSNHDGHCSLIHGHNWDFEICLGSNNLDENGFVYDFGKFKKLREWFDEMFDHTLVLNSDDPHLKYFEAQEEFGLAKVITIPSCSCEGIAKLIYNKIETMLMNDEDGRIRDFVHVSWVKVFEDHKNATIYTGS